MAKPSLIDEALQACKKTTSKRWDQELNPSQKEELERLVEEHRNGRLKTSCRRHLAVFIVKRFDLKVSVASVSRYLLEAVRG